MSDTPRRKPVGKRLRFSIFARDNFTCKYCGKQSDEVPLHLDHVIPVSKGGTNDESNLVTSCRDCNLGKSNIEIDQAAPTESDRLRMLQEAHEQEEAARRALVIVQSRKLRKDELIGFWCDTTGRDEYDVATLNVVFSYVRDLGEDLVYSWIEKAAATCWNDQNMGKYISGIRRKYLEEMEGGGE